MGGGGGEENSIAHFAQYAVHARYAQYAHFAEQSIQRVDMGGMGGMDGGVKGGTDGGTDGGAGYMGYMGGIDDYSYDGVGEMDIVSDVGEKCDVDTDNGGRDNALPQGWRVEKKTRVGGLTAGKSQSILQWPSSCNGIPLKTLP